MQNASATALHDAVACAQEKAIPGSSQGLVSTEQQKMGQEQQTAVVAVSGQTSCRSSRQQVGAASPPPCAGRTSLWWRTARCGPLLTLSMANKHCWVVSRCQMTCSLIERTLDEASAFTIALQNIDHTAVRLWCGQSRQICAHRNLITFVKRARPWGDVERGGHLLQLLAWCHQG